MDQVGDVRADLSQIGFDLDALQRMVSGLVSSVIELKLYPLFHVIFFEALW